MNTYNFDLEINRRGTNSMKWDLYANDVLPLWVADMDFAAPSEIINAIETRIDHPVFGYANHTDAQLMDIICAWLERRHGWQVKPEQIMLMSGVVTGINWAARTFATQDAGILIQTPVYPPFHRVAGNAGLNMLKNPLVKTGTGYEIDFDDFEEKLSQGVGMFVLCNPHNPVGRVFTQEELEKIGEICLRNKVVICSDEIHCDLIYSGQHHIPIASLSEELSQNAITLMAASKTFNIPGLHFSFAVVPNEGMRKRLEKVGAGMIGYPSFLANEAAKAAFSRCDDWLASLRDYLQGNRNFMMQFIKENMPDIKMFQPQGTYLAWLDCSRLDLQPDPHHFFLDEAKVALNDGVTFGANGSGYVRLNFGCPRSTLETALKQMAAALE